MKVIIDREEDARGLRCPLPVLRAKKALAALESGQVLRIQTTDTSARDDFQAFARQTGHVLLHQEVLEDASIVHYLRRR